MSSDDQPALAAGPQVPAVARDLGRRFTDAGHALALVGGCVRDLILNRPISDLDFTTDARPERTHQVLSGWADRVWDVGRAFGTIAARRGDVVVEVTTYRADAYDRSSRKPVVAYGDRLVDDLARRDFTVNAMAVELPDGGFIDPHHGLQDLVSGRLITPGRPPDSFGDDPLRMLRAARFTAQLGLTVTEPVRQAMTAMTDRLAIVSAERIRDELVKLILTDRPRPGLELLVDTGLADVVLPELPALRLELDEHHRHKDVYQHSLTVLDQVIGLEGGEVPGPDLVLRLAALLHDIGKPATRRFEPGGRVSFHHHEVVGAKLTRKRMRALRFDTATIAAVSRLVELHLRFHGYGDGGWTDAAVRRYVTDAEPHLHRLHRLTRADVTTRNERKAARLARSYDDLERRIAQLAEQEELAAIRPELNGEQIMTALGAKPGPLVGRAYQHLLGFRLDHGPVGEVEARAELLRWWSEQPESTDVDPG
ncbi:MAG: CCA tRNA nucleotidyltransferase [Angustibacter sp.]